MSKLIIAVLISLVVGFAAASWIALDTGTPSPPAAGGGTPAGVSFDADASVEQRILALEQAVSDERQARQLLQEEVLILTDELERLSPPPQRGGAVESGGERLESAQADPAERLRRRDSTESRIDRLVEAGFEPAYAEWLVQRESELQMEALQARYDAERKGEDYDYFSSRNAANQQLREELGDAEYERYLVANGRPTSVAISSVMASSPAQSAGLRVGDEIVRYDGERIFSMSDLSRVTMEGEPGVSVVLDIVRDGAPMQVVLPRGPVGITTGRRFSR